MLCVLVMLKIQTKNYQQGIIHVFILLNVIRECAMRLVLGFIFLGITLILSACSSGPGIDEFAPKIGEISTTISHHYSEDPQDEYTISFIIRANVTDPDGLDDITGIYVVDKNNEGNDDHFRILKDKSELSSTTDCFQDREIIECSFYPKELDNLHDLNLAEYELVAVDRHNYSSRKSFKFKLPDGIKATTEEFVYSESSSRDKESGIAALEVMTVADNNLKFVLDTVEESLQIDFTSNDARASNYAIALYDDSDVPKLIGNIRFDSQIIQKATIKFEEPTVLAVPGETVIESLLEEGYTFLDIGGLKITLLDLPTTSSLQEVTNSWFNYQGVSEFVPINGSVMPL